MPEKKQNLYYNALSVIEGYKKILEQKKQLEKTGSDFSDHKGKVAKTITKLHPKRIMLEVDNIIDDTLSTKTFRLKSTSGILPPFQAGQYINLFVDIDGVKTARPYAISSSPLTRDYYDLTVKLVDGGFVTNYLLSQVKVGQQLSSTGPMGSFYHNPLFHGDDLVFLAGGSGIAPAMSMLKNVFERSLGYKFHFIYASSFVTDVIFIDELRGLADKHSGFTLTEVISRPPADHKGLTGYLTSELLEDLIGNVKEKMFYVCGPTPFNDFCLEQLTSLGVKGRHIRVEVNGPPKSPNQFDGWPSDALMDDEVTVTIQGKGSFKAKVGEPLLNSMERNGYTAENACRSGECSLCRVKIKSGSVFNPPESKLRKSDKDFGWIHSCVAFPLEDIEIIV